VILSSAIVVLKLSAHFSSVSLFGSWQFWQVALLRSSVLRVAKAGEPSLHGMCLSGDVVRRAPICVGEGRIPEKRGVLDDPLDPSP